MGFSREPIWDRSRNMAGMVLSFHEPLDDLLGAERHSLWSSLAKATPSALLPKRGSLIWALDSRLWSQACEMSRSHRDSFDQWCRHLRDHGIQIASPEISRMLCPVQDSTELALALARNSVALHLDGFSMDKASIGLAAKCAGILLDAATMDHELCCNLFHKFMAAGKSAIVTKLSSPTALSHFSALGVSPYTGRALWNPRSATRSSKIEPAAQKALQALGLACSDGELADIDEVFQSDPALAYKLIGLVNSAGLSRSEEKVGSVKQALLLLGRAQLAKWLSTLVLRAAHAKPEASALRWSLSARAKLCERLALLCPEPELAGEAFVCGIFSGLDALLGQSRGMILESCPLPERMRDALDSGTGRLGAVLALASACESPTGLGSADLSLVTACSVELAGLDAARLEAYEWACAFA